MIKREIISRIGMLGFVSLCAVSVVSLAMAQDSGMLMQRSGNALLTLEDKTTFGSSFNVAITPQHYTLNADHVKTLRIIKGKRQITLVDSGDEILVVVREPKQ